MCGAVCCAMAAPGSSWAASSINVAAVVALAHPAPRSLAIVAPAHSPLCQLLHGSAAPGWKDTSMVKDSLQNELLIALKAPQRFERVTAARSRVQFMGCPGHRCVNASAMPRCLHTSATGRARLRPFVCTHIDQRPSFMRQMPSDTIGALSPSPAPASAFGRDVVLQPLLLHARVHAAGRRAGRRRRDTTQKPSRTASWERETSMWQKA
jgi:hypothetical protein